MLKEFIEFLEAAPDTTYDSMSVRGCAIAQFGAHREKCLVYAGAHEYLTSLDKGCVKVKVIPDTLSFLGVIHANRTFGALAADLRKRAGGRYDI